jgi:DMSO reductase family type II enzyme chaperone
MRTRSEPAPSEIERALCRSGLWEALALGFAPPTDETLQRLVAPAGAAGLAAMGAVLDEAEGTAIELVAAALAVEPAPSLDTLRLRYARLFGHTARGAAPLYEIEHGEDSLFAPQREMSDLGAFFRAFGLQVDAGAHERPDHIACECEFLLVLARKEARAHALGDTPMWEVTRGAARAFLRDHLGRWAPALGASIAGLDADGFYGALGRLLAAFAAAECRRVGVTPGPEFLRLRSPAPDDTPMACGPLVAAPDA